MKIEVWSGERKDISYYYKNNHNLLREVSVSLTVPHRFLPWGTIGKTLDLTLCLYGFAPWFLSSSSTSLTRKHENKNVKL